jgi:hypothetical protein
VIELGVLLALLVVGLFIGQANERRRFRELAVLEESLRDIVVYSGRGSVNDGAFRSAALVVGAVVIAEDYFKRVAAALKSLVGGRLVAYESLLERGRRESDRAHERAGAAPRRNADRHHATRDFVAVRGLERTPADVLGRVLRLRYGAGARSHDVTLGRAPRT